MHIQSIANTISLVLAVVFALSGAVHVAGPRLLRDIYRRWGYARQFHRVVGGLQLLSALFLVLPETRLWGVIFAEFITFVGVIALLHHSRYASAIPAMLIMIALPVAIVSVPW